MDERPRPLRRIVHVDMDAFYASVEQRDRPETRGKPVIVGGTPEGRGVVCSASYEARRFGVRSAMSARKAKQLCPDAIFLRVDMARYKEASRRIQAMFREVTPLVEPLSLDEAYLDVTTNSLGEPYGSRIAKELRRRIREELQLTASAGVGPNKFIAKLASDLRKPDALVVVPPERVAELLARLPVDKLWGVGPATARKLRERGFDTTEDLRRVSPEALVSLLGRFGRFIHNLAHGIDDRPVRAERVAKSRGSETTFPSDIRSLSELENALVELVDDVTRATDRIAKHGRTITLKVRFSNFQTITRRRTFAHSLDDPKDLLAGARDLLHELRRDQAAPVRLLGVSVSGFSVPGEPEQLELSLDTPHQ